MEDISKTNFDFTITKPNRTGTIKLTADSVCELIKACGIYIDDMKEFYPKAHADILQAFEDAAKENPDFAFTKDLFITTMC